MDTYPTLYRHLTSRAAADAHLAGEFQFGALSHFRTLEDDVRQDKSEGKASYQIAYGLHVSVASDESPIQAIYILSLSECAHAPDFGSYRVAIGNPGALVEMIKQALPNDVGVSLDKVRYGKPEILEHELNPVELADRAWSTKPETHAHEQEWRIVIVFPPTFKIANPRLHLSIGDCSDLLKIPEWIDPGDQGRYLEELRCPHELFIPDVRSTHITSLTGTREHDLFQWMKEAELKGCAPQGPREAYDIARNLFLYSWYQYRFTMVAVLQAILALEMALRTRLEKEGMSLENSRGHPKTLRTLLNVALKEGWFTDGGFGEWLPKKIDTCGNVVGDFDPQGNEYCKGMCAALSDIRNSMAHGSKTIMDQPVMADFIRRICALIDQLFPSDDLDQRSAA
ncbi:MAG: hypothetical protein MI806_08095 [Minwuiales bacterium]|nr:hypothetical protein [Minwuiales bacterium]